MNMGQSVHLEMHLPTRIDITLKNKLECISQIQQSTFISINTVNHNENSELINNDLSTEFITDREVTNINAQEVIEITPPSKYEITQKRISSALSLDLSLFPRPSRDKTTTIPLHQQKQSNTNDRVMIIMTAKRWVGV